METVCFGCGSQIEDEGIEVTMRAFTNGCSASKTWIFGACCRYSLNVSLPNYTGGDTCDPSVIAICRSSSSDAPSRRDLDDVREFIRGDMRALEERIDQELMTRLKEAMRQIEEERIPEIPKPTEIDYYGRKVS